MSLDVRLILGAILGAIAVLSGCGSSTRTKAEPAPAEAPPADRGAAIEPPPAAADTRAVAAEPSDRKAGDGVADRAGPRPGLAEDAGGATEAPCLKAPEATGATATITKGPYLQEPTTTSMTVVVETLEDVPVTVAVRRDGETCLTALVTAPGAKMEVPSLPVDPPEGFQHAALVTGLKAGTTYRYVVTAGATATEESAFRTAPGPGQDYAIAVMGDNRTYADDHQAVVDAIVTEMPDLYMNTGDALEFGLDLGQWGGFFNIERELLRIAPLMPAFGNHEAMAGQAYYAGYWHLPNPFDASELDYAYAYGSSYFIVIDSNDTPKGERLDWLKARLADAQAFPFRFVAFHHPLFTFSFHKPQVAMRAVLHPLFLEAKITAVLNGHNHCYERFVVDGLPYVVTGGGGAPLHSINAHFIEAESAQRVAARTAHHYVMMAFSGLTVTFTVRDTDKDELIETFTLQGNPP